MIMQKIWLEHHAISNIITQHIVNRYRPCRVLSISAEDDTMSRPHSHSHLNQLRLVNLRAGM